MNSWSRWRGNDCPKRIGHAAKSAGGDLGKVCEAGSWSADVRGWRLAVPAVHLQPVDPAEERPGDPDRVFLRGGAPEAFPGENDLGEGNRSFRRGGVETAESERRLENSLEEIRAYPGFPCGRCSGGIRVEWPWPVPAVEIGIEEYFHRL